MCVCERESVCVRERKYYVCLCERGVCVRVCIYERVCVCMREREYCVCVRERVCVCERQSSERASVSRGGRQGGRWAWEPRA